MKLSLNIPDTDIREIQWFISCPNLTLEGCMGGESGFGHMLERAENLSHHTVPCRTCKGDGWVRVVPGLKRKDQGYVAELAKAVGLFEKDHEDLPPALDIFCETCQGRCFVSRKGRSRPKGPVTVNFSETASPSQTSRSAEPPDLALTARYERIRTKLEDLSELCPDHAKYLEAWLMRDSEHWPHTREPEDIQAQALLNAIASSWRIVTHRAALEVA